MDKVVIVTGGGRGIGAATARLLAARGYAVCVNYRSNHQTAAAVVADIRNEGGRAIAFQADVSLESDVAALFHATEQAFGTVNYLVNNAAVIFSQSSFTGISLKRFNQILLSNVTSCFLCCREFLLRKPQSGAIVNVSSAAARTGSPFEYIDYAASKGAVDSLTKGLALEVAASGIRVNAVRPGFIHTDMHADGGEPDRVNRLAPQIPLQRGGTVCEVAQVIVWLLSDEASYVTGAFIDVAGGK